MTQTSAPTEYDFSGLPESQTTQDDTPARGTRLLLLLVAPVLGLVVTIAGIVLRGLAEHDIASTQAAPATPAPLDDLTSLGTSTETASQLVYLARDTGTAALLAGAALIAVGVGLIIWNAMQPTATRTPTV